MPERQKQFQDGHEIMQHYVPGYEVPDVEPQQDPGLTLDDTHGRVLAAHLLKHFSELVKPKKTGPSRTT